MIYIKKFEGWSIGPNGLNTEESNNKNMKAEQLEMDILDMRDEIVSAFQKFSDDELCLNDILPFEVSETIVNDPGYNGELMVGVSPKNDPYYDQSIPYEIEEILEEFGFEYQCENGYEIVDMDLYNEFKQIAKDQGNKYFIFTIN